MGLAYFHRCGHWWLHKILSYPPTFYHPRAILKDFNKFYLFIFQLFGEYMSRKGTMNISQPKG
jgi:hypothetical protein